MNIRLPKKYPAFLKLLVDIAEHGDSYEGSVATPLSEADDLRIREIVGEIKSWLITNEDMLERVGLSYSPDSALLSHIKMIRQ